MIPDTEIVRTPRDSGLMGKERHEKTRLYRRMATNPDLDLS